MTSTWKKLLIGGLILAFGFFHYSCQLYLVEHMQIHNVIMKCFYIPILLAAFWMGFRGGALVGLGCSLIYSIDIIRWWEPNGVQNYNHVAEMIVFVVVGSLLGLLVDSDRRSKKGKFVAEEKAKMEFQKAITDPLTSAFNRRYMEKIINESWEKAEKGLETFSLLMIDLNFFKIINDRYGHPMGDRVLKDTAQTIFSQIRSNDFLFRYAGDEFLILLPNSRADRAMSLAKRLREEIGKITFQGPQQIPFKTDFSVGVIEYHSDFQSSNELLAKLDESLYRAKKVSSHIALAS